jgi:phosphoenolpyruvate synthase/pyruvate phosphate dikinase
MEGFEDGMILVAYETTPEVIFAMQKSGAIVTDFGGLTCHAAIVAREMKKPCIVGTKNATKIFKDGDMVEVDANKGIVRLITDNDASQEPSLDIAALAKSSWHYIHKRLRTPLFTYLLWEGVRAHHNKKVDFPYEMPWVLYLNQEISFGTSVWDHLEEKAINHFKEDKNFLLKIMEESYRLDSKIVSLCKKLGKINWSKKSNQEIISAFKEYITITLEAGAFLIVPLFLENYLENFLKKIIEDSSIRDKTEALHLLSSPLKQSPIQESEISLLKMAIAKAAGRSVEKSIDQHIKEYGWLKNNALNGEIYTPKEIKKIVELLSKENPKQKLAQLATERKEFLTKVKKYKKALGLTKEITRSIETLQEAIYFRSWRSERYYRNAVLLNSLYQEINKRLGAPHINDVFYLLPEEIITGLEKGVHDWSKIEERKDGYIIFGDKEATRIYSDKIVEEAQEKINFGEEIDHTKEITGQIAFPGKAQGRVCVVLSKADFTNVEEGDILVECKNDIAPGDVLEAFVMKTV